MNNTGLRLTQADLIRNYLFMRLPTRGEQVYRSLWAPLQRRLDSDQLELLFWLDLVQGDEQLSRPTPYALQQARLDQIEGEGAIESEVGRFARMGELLSLILDPRKESTPTFAVRWRGLNAWGTATAYPVLLHLLDRRERNEATSAEVASAMRYLESFFVRRLVVGQATKNINRILLRAVRDIRGQAPSDAVLRDYLSTGRKSFATDSEIRAAADTVPFYWSGRAAAEEARAYVDRGDLREQGAGSTDQLTIEHVLPQSLTDGWRAEPFRISRRTRTRTLCTRASSTRLATSH